MPWGPDDDLAPFAGLSNEEWETLMYQTCPMPWMSLPRAGAQ